MRKIFFSLLLFVVVQAAHAQFNTIKFSPTSFTGDDSVTFTIDLTGTPLAGASSVYIWTWCNAANLNGIVNGTWGASLPSAKMTNVGGNVWRYGLVGSTMYGLQPGQLNYFQFLCKSIDGSQQTGNSPEYNFQPVAYTPVTYRVFPSMVGLNDPITLYFYQNLVSDSTDQTEARMKPVSFTITLQDSSSAINQIGSPITLPVKDLGQQLYSVSFIPNVSWNITNPAIVKQFTYIVNGTGYDASGNTINVTGTKNTRVFDALQ